MNKELLKLLLDSLEKLVLAWLDDRGCEVSPRPEPRPEPQPNPPESPDEEVPETPREDPKPDTGHSAPNQKLYVPRDRRQEWIDKLRNAYSVWRGEREYAAILQYRDTARPYLESGGISFSEINSRMRRAQESHARSQRLQYRIDTEIHRKFRDRSQVRKSVVNEMYAELQERTREYGEVARLFPFTRGCDSIRCKLKKLSERQ